MHKNWKITVWGVRGSAPVPSQKFMEYGGNTSCISVSFENHMIIFDAGTGLSAFGREGNLLKNMRLDILISHLHIDHVMGLFTFQPFLCADMEIHLYGRTGMERKLRRLLSPPWWPLRVQDFKAKLYFHEIQTDDSFQIGSVTVSAMEGNHPGGSILYRLDGDNKRLLYALDCEYNEKFFAKVSEFTRGSDLIIWDANFAPEDFREGWGHSTWKHGVKMRNAASVRRVLMTHYSHEYTDVFLHRLERVACKDNRCIFAKEGMEIML